MKPPRVPEKAEQQQIVQLLRQVFGAWVWELGTTRGRRDYHKGTRQTPGLPDLIAFLPPKVTPRFEHSWRLLVIECKGAGGRLRPEQQIFRQCCIDAGTDHLTGGYNVVVAWLIENEYAKPEQFPVYRQPKVAR